MNDIFKNLDLNREQILETIKEFLATKPHLDAQVADELELKNAAQGLYRCNISTNSGTFFLDMFYRTDGKTTLQSNNGNAQFSELKIELCRYIDKNCKKGVTQKDKKDPWFTANNINCDDVRSVISLIKESSFYESELPHSEGNGFPTWKFKGVQKETLTITYFNKNTNGVGKLLLQGKPELLFLQSMEIITQLFDTDEIETKFSDSGFFESQIDESIVQNDISSIMPNAFDKLPSDQLKKTVKQAIIFKNFKSNFEDYTVYTFPAYRALEGHLRWVLSELGIDWLTKLDSKGKPASTSFYMFDKVSSEGAYSYVLQSCYHVNVESKYPTKKEQFLTYIGELYQILSDERNSYFHWKKLEPGLMLDETVLIEDEEMARAIIVKCLTKIEEYYKLFY
jgi:hypothetical protein